MPKQKTIKIVITQQTIEQYAKYYFQLHPRAYKMPIQHPYHESINVWMIMKRPQMNALKQKWKDFIIWLINDLGYQDMKLDNCTIKQVVYFGRNGRHDADNTVPKFILDGFVESGFIVDDDIKHIKELSLSGDVDKDNPRTEFIIKVLD